VEPISLVEAKAHLKVDVTADDDYITALITAARQRLEIDAGLAIITQTLEMGLDCFPMDGSPIKLKRPLLQSITSIIYVDSDGVDITWDSSEYRMDLASKPARITPAYGYSYPVAIAVTGAVKIRYVAGYGDAGTDVPKDLIRAMLMLIGHWYENREDVVIGTITSTVPKAYSWLKASHQVTTC